MKNEVDAFLSLDCLEQEVAEITRQMDMEPSRVVVTSMADDSVPGGTVKLHLWQLVSSLPESANVNRHVEHLMEVLSPHAETVRTFANRRGGSIHCSITYRRPPCPAEICVWQPTVQSLATMGLSLTFDVFFDPAPGWNDDAPIECY